MYQGGTVGTDPVSFDFCSVVCYLPFRCVFIMHAAACVPNGEYMLAEALISIDKME